MTQKGNLVYRVQRPDGSFRGGGAQGGRGVGNRKVKVWTSPAHVKNHLKLGSKYDEPVEQILKKADAENDVIIEYELIERRRIPAKEFLSDG